MSNTLPVSAGGAWLDAIPRSLLCGLYCDLCRLVSCNRAKARRIATRLNTITAAALRMCCRRPGFRDFPSAGRKNAIGVEIEGAPVDIVHGCVVAHHGFTRCFARLTDRRVGVPLPACVSSTQGTTAQPRTGSLCRKTALDAGREVVGIDRLGNDVGGAQLPGDLEEIGVADAPAAGNSDHLRIRPLAANLSDGLNAFLFRHDDVSDHQVGLLAAEQAHPALAVLSAHHVITQVLEKLDHGRPHDYVIVDNEDLAHLCLLAHFQRASVGLSVARVCPTCPPTVGC